MNLRADPRRCTPERLFLRAKGVTLEGGELDVTRVCNPCERRSRLVGSLNTKPFEAQRSCTPEGQTRVTWRIATNGSYTPSGHIETWYTRAMRRSTKAVATSLSLLLCMATIALWMTSYRRTQYVGLGRPDHWLGALSMAGILRLERGGFPMAREGWSHESYPAPAGGLWREL